MKQSILLIFFLQCFLFVPVSGQDTRFSIAAEGGPGITNFIVAHQKAKYFKPILGGYTGILVNYNFSTLFSLRSGLTYERNGTNFKSDFYDIKSDLIYHFDYLSIPVLLRAQIGGKIRFYIQAGAYYSILCNQQYFARQGSKYANVTSALKNYNELNRINNDYGILGGIGMEIKVSRKSAISIGISDFLGLCNTKKQPPLVSDLGEDLGFDTNTANNIAILQVGFSTGIGKSR